LIPNIANQPSFSAVRRVTLDCLPRQHNTLNWPTKSYAENGMETTDTRVDTMLKIRLTRTIAAALFGLVLMSTVVSRGAIAQMPITTSDNVAPENLISAAAAREDLTQLYSTLKEAHYDLYARRSRVEYDKFYAKTRDSITGPLSRLEAAKRLQQFLAYGRVAHANTNVLYELAIAHRGQGGNLLPLYMQLQGDRFFLTETADVEGTLRPGAELLLLNGKAISWWRQQLGRYISADNEYLAAAQMENAFPLLLWLELGNTPSVEVKARRQDGSIVNTKVKALTRPALAELRVKHPTPELATDFTSREIRLMGDGVAYLRPGPFYNTETQAGDTGPSYEDSKYRSFLDDAFVKLIDANVTDLLIDLRNNPGGDNSFSDPMIAWFADRPFRFADNFMLKASAATKAHYQLLKANGTKEEGIIGELMRAEASRTNGERYPFPIPMVEPRKDRRFIGRVFVLQNRNSYSNAASVSALIQDYKFGKILGEETADLVSTFGSTVPFKLKHTGINVSYPKSRITRINGDIRARGVVPDIAIAAPALGISEDVVLSKAFDLIKADREIRR
jgi:Peptidase family S41